MKYHEIASKTSPNGTVPPFSSLLQSPSVAAAFTVFTVFAALAMATAMAFWLAAWTISLAKGSSATWHTGWMLLRVGCCWSLLVGTNMKCNPQWNVDHRCHKCSKPLRQTSHWDVLAVILWPQAQIDQLGLGYQGTTWKSSLTILNLNYGSRKHGLWAWTPWALVRVDLDQTSKPLKPTNWLGLLDVWWDVQPYNFGAPMARHQNYQKPT